MADAARLAAVGGPEVRSEHPDPAVAAEPDPGRWTEADALTPHPARGEHAEPDHGRGVLGGEVPAPTAAPESGPGSWTAAVAPHPARLAAVGPWPAAEAQPGAVGGSEVRGEHPVTETEPGRGRWAPAAESGSGRRADVRAEAGVPVVRGEHPAPETGSGHGRWTEAVGVRPGAEAPASHPTPLAAIGGPEAAPGHGRWAEDEALVPAAGSRHGRWAEDERPGHPGESAVVDGPEAQAGFDRWSEAAVPAGRAEPAAPAGVPDVRAEAGSERWAEAAVPGGQAEVPGSVSEAAAPAGQAEFPGPVASVGVPDVRAEFPASVAEVGVPDGRGEVPVPLAPSGVPEVRAEVGSGRWAEGAVPGGRVEVSDLVPEAGVPDVRAKVGSEGWVEAAVLGGQPEFPAPVPDARAEPLVPVAPAGVPDVRAEFPASVAEGPVPDGRGEVPVPLAPVGVSGGRGEGGSGEGPAVVVPHTRDGDEGEARPGPGEVPAARGDGSAVPGPGVVDLVARAVARGIRGPEVADGQDGGLLRAGRGGGVAEVPVRLPFRTQTQTQTQTQPSVTPRAAAAAARPRAGAGRRVPRGDDRLREHRGPVLPGWAAVLVGALALTGCAAVLWRAGVVPAVVVAAFGATPRAYQGLRVTHWPPLAFLGVVALVALGGLGRARAGHAWVLTLFGRYRGTVRRTGLTWVSPLLLRRRVDVRLRHWRSDPMPAVDAGGLALRAVVQVVWQVKDTARATLAVEDHTEYLAEQVESAMARVLSQLPADAFHEDAPTLRDAEAVGDALTRMLAAETEAVGIEVYSAQPTRIEYAPEVAEAMRRRRVAAIDAKHRDAVLTSVVDAVDDTVHRLTSRGLVELDDYERKALVKDLTVAFYTGRPE
ncbi:SPFH domain-containing protein [Streptomyces goshikiensis]|uniref:SPFH domain-containing protein n=1 Tax=Streptomyces goshikiensis TaxID=1942 RepID=UPI00365730A4